MCVCVGNVAVLPPPPPLSLSLSPRSLGGRRDEREAEALIDTAPIDTPPERERFIHSSQQMGRREEEEEDGGGVLGLTHAQCVMG